MKECASLDMNDVDDIIGKIYLNFKIACILIFFKLPLCAK